MLPLNFILYHPLLHSKMLLGCMGIPSQIFFCGACLYTQFDSPPKQHRHYSVGTISCDTIKEISHQAVGVIYLPGYSPGTKTLGGPHRHEF